MFLLLFILKKNKFVFGFRIVCSFCLLLFYYMTDKCIFKTITVSFFCKTQYEWNVCYCKLQMYCDVFDMIINDFRLKTASTDGVLIEFLAEQYIIRDKQLEREMPTL